MSVEEIGLAGKDEAIRISNLEVDSIIKRLMSLSLEEIDELWCNVGWIDVEAKNDKRNALPNWRLQKIKDEKDFAYESFVNIVTDGPYQELRTAAVFLQNLNKILGGKK